MKNDSTNDSATDSDGSGPSSPIEEDNLGKYSSLRSRLSTQQQLFYACK